MAAGRVLVSMELLIELLRFPAGTRIVNAGLHPADPNGAVILTVVHPDIRAIDPDGDAAPPLVRPIFREGEPEERREALFVRWGQD